MALAGDRIVIGTVDGYYETDEKGTVISEKNNRLPVPEIRKLLSANGRHWFATDFGAYYKDREGIRYFTEERWLDQNNVIDMTLDRSGNAYLLTPTGLNKIHFKSFTSLIFRSFNSSIFKVLKNVSAHALSQQLPRLLIL